MSLSVLTQSLLPGRAVSAASTVNQHKPDPITGYTEGDLDKRSGVEKVVGEKRKDQKREIELIKIFQTKIITWKL